MSASERPISDPCAGCVNRSAEGVYAMECFGCRRYYGHTDGADLYSAPRLPLLGVGP